MKKSGFTIIEVALFLSLSGFLMIGLIVSANISIARQRYNDSVNSFGEFFRGVYADVMNVSNDKALTDSPGRTTTAIYGKYVSIGETNDEGENNGTIYVYDIAGNAVNSTVSISSNLISALNDSNLIAANIFEPCPSPSACLNNPNKPYRMTNFNAPWDAELQDSNGTKFVGGILVVRSPVTGGIRTYIYDSKEHEDEIQFYHFHKMLTDSNASTYFSNLLGVIADSVKNNDGKSERDLDLCIDSPDNSHANRRDLRILARANNSTSVVLVPLDGEDSKCLGN